MLEEPIEDLEVPSESIREEEPRNREDQDEPKSEEEQLGPIHPGATLSPQNE
jgi:hypothetical protein